MEYTSCIVSWITSGRRLKEIMKDEVFKYVILYWSLIIRIIIKVVLSQLSTYSFICIVKKYRLYFLKFLFFSKISSLHNWIQVLQDLHTTPR